jgi:hypothetical protein
MVAGMVHDYGHPQINNACLIEEVIETRHYIHTCLQLLSTLGKKE